jgi:hypothetical protein
MEKSKRPFVKVILLLKIFQDQEDIFTRGTGTKLQQLIFANAKF